jgi:hypothetical protein
MSAPFLCREERRRRLRCSRRRDPLRLSY